MKFFIQPDAFELEGVEQAPVRGFYTGGKEMGVRRLILAHYTEGTHGDTSIDFWKNDPKCIKDDIGAHVIIERDGHVRQCRAFNRTISHAGVSRWQDPRPQGVKYKMLNRFAIGIELANTGDQTQRITAEDKLPGYAGTVRAMHRNGGKEKVWEKYSDAQIQALVAVSLAIKERFNTDDFTGHDCVAPERKLDPGPAFPMEWVRQQLGYTGLPVVFQP